jgi:hypothetical protein
LDKSWLMKFVEHRVADPRILRLIQKSYPIRGDVKGKFFSLPSWEIWMLSLQPAPFLLKEGFLVLNVFGAPRFPAAWPTQSFLPTRRFHAAAVTLDAFGSGSYASLSVGQSANHDPI